MVVSLLASFMLPKACLIVVCRLYRQRSSTIPAAHPKYGVCNRYLIAVPRSPAIVFLRLNQRWKYRYEVMDDT